MKSATYSVRMQKVRRFQ